MPTLDIILGYIELKFDNGYIYECTLEQEEEENEEEKEGKGGLRSREVLSVKGSLINRGNLSYDSLYIGSPNR